MNYVTVVMGTPSGSRPVKWNGWRERSETTIGGLPPCFLSALASHDHPHYPNGPWFTALGKADFEYRELATAQARDADCKRFARPRLV